MEGILVSILTTAITGILVLAFYFSLGIYQFLTKKDFGHANIYLVYFTRNDNPKKSDAVHFRMIEYGVLLREIYRNRFLFWRVFYTSMWVTVDKPVLDFGEHRLALLSPIRGRIAALNAENEFKRVAGYPFKETRYQAALVYDRSEDKRAYVLRVLMIRHVDLVNFQQYLDKPPKTGENFELLRKIADAYKTKPGSFISVQIVTTD